MARDYVWAIDENGEPCKCYASPENRGKGKCNHSFHVKDFNAFKKAFEEFSTMEKDEKEKNKVKKSDKEKELERLKKDPNSMANKEAREEEELIAKNKEEFKNLLSSIDREGIDDIIQYCEEHDMYVAPSSTRFHLCSKGGLLQHSLNVYNAAKNMLFDNGDGTYSYKINGTEVARISEDTLKISTLLHDFCKMDTYKPTYGTKKYDDGSERETITKWSFKEELPFGHGEKSVYVINKMMDLTEEEASAIRWHMGAFGNEEQSWPMTNAIKKYPIIWAIHNADMEASTFMEGRNTNYAKFK